MNLESTNNAAAEAPAPAPKRIPNEARRIVEREVAGHDKFILRLDVLSRHEVRPSKRLNATNREFHDNPGSPQTERNRPLTGNWLRFAESETGNWVRFAQIGKRAQTRRHLPKRRLPRKNRKEVSWKASQPASSP